VGIVLYLLGTGELPFSGRNPHEVLRRIAEGKFPDPRSTARGVDQVLSRIITRALARQPDDRYPDVGPLCDDLTAYLNEAGLTDVRAELRAYFGDPAAYDQALPGRLAAALTESARTQLGTGRRAKAMELWNRVLAFDPENETVTAALRRLQGRRRLHQAMAATALVAAAAGGLLAAAHHRSSHLPPAAVTPALPAAAHLTPAPPAAPLPGAPVMPPASQRRALAAVHPVRSRAEGRPPAAVDPNGALRVFTLGPTPQNVDVYLDGKRQFAYDPDHTTIAVPWNVDHVLELRSPSGCCFVERVEIGPDHPLPSDAIIARRLKWRPAHLVVTTEPAVASARVLVSDPNRKVAATAGRPGEELDVPFFADDDSSKEIEVAVDAGEAFATEKIRVRAGERLTHVVKLKTGATAE